MSGFTDSTSANDGSHSKIEFKKGGDYDYQSDQK